MAKPFEVRESPAYYPDTNISLSGPSPHPTGSRKRTRKSDPATCEETSILCEYPEDSHKTRRVNPQRLAARLDPELVAEMEAYIIPGAKMPNFTVRKDFQERYCVDRRHIYDYFHSRGLRVAKEDKHTNLTRGRMTSTMSRRPPQESTPENSVKLNTLEGVIPEIQPDRLVPIMPKILPKKSVSHLVSPKIPVAKPRRRLGHSKTRMTELSPCLSSSEVSYSLADDEDSNYDAPGSPCPEFTFPDEYPKTPLLVEDSEISVYDSTSELHDLYGMAENLGLDFLVEDCPIENSASFAFIEDHRPLTEGERNEFYNLINGSLPQSGMAERSGTYSAYMEEQTRRYFDRLAKNSVPYSRRDTYQPATETLAEVDFQKWLAIPGRHDSFKTTNFDGEEAPTSHLVDIYDQRTRVSTDIQTLDDVDVLFHHSLGSGMADAHGMSHCIPNKNIMSTTQTSRVVSRSFSGQDYNGGENSPKTVDNSIARNTYPKATESRGLYECLVSGRITSYAVPSRPRTNSACGGI